MRVLLHGSYGSVLWPHTALFLHSVIFVWLLQGDTCKIHSAVCIFHISFSSFNFLILVQVTKEMSEIF